MTFDPSCSCLLPPMRCTRPAHTAKPNDDVSRTTTISLTLPLCSSATMSSLSSPSANPALNSSLSRLSFLSSVERATGIPRLYCAVALLVLASGLVFQGWGLRLLTTLVAFFYPLYCSLRCLCAPHSYAADPSRGPRLWLVYWLVFGLLSFSERLSDSLLSFLPLYYPLKLAFLLWCFLPQSEGCAVLYDCLLHPLLARHSPSIERSVGDVREAVGAVGEHVVREGRKMSVQLLNSPYIDSMRQKLNVLSPSSAGAAAGTSINSTSQLACGSGSSSSADRTRPPGGS